MKTNSHRTARSACPYDCPDTCGLLVEAEGDRVVGVKGDPDHPITKGFLCRKMARYELSVNHPDRILHPLRRTGRKGLGKFTRISWDEALTEIAGRWQDIIARYGGEAILPYSYSGVMSVIGRHCGNAFFNRMGASGLGAHHLFVRQRGGLEGLDGRNAGPGPARVGEERLHHSLGQ